MELIKELMSKIQTPCNSELDSSLYRAKRKTWACRFCENCLCIFNPTESDSLCWKF